MKREENPGFFRNVGRGAKRGFKQRGAGLVGFGMDVGEALGADLSEEQAALAEYAAQLNQEGKGTGAGGFIGEVVGDPLTFAPWMSALKGMGLASKVVPRTLPKASSVLGNAINKVVGPTRATVGNIAKSGALASGTGAFLGAQEDPEEGLGDRATSAAGSALLGGMISGGIPIAGNITGGLYRVGRGIGQRGMTALGSKAGASATSERIIADKLIDEGISPQAIRSAGQSAKDSGIRQTLGESTGSGSLLAIERGLLAGKGKASRFARTAVNTRAESLVPKKINEKADELLFGFKKAEGAYDQAKKEVNNKIQMARAGDPDALMSFGRIQNTIAGIKSDIAKQNNEILDKSGIAAKTLSRINGIIDSLERKPISFEVLHQAKKDIADLYIEGGTKGQEKKISDVIGNYVKAIDNQLAELAPNSFKTGDMNWMEGLAGREVRNTLAKSKERGLATFFDKIWSIPVKREEFLRKLPNEASRREWAALAEGLGKASSFHTNAPTKSISGGITDLTTATIGLNPAATNPLMGMSSMVKTAAKGTYIPRIERNLTSKLFRPDTEEIARLVEKRLSEKAISAPIAYGSPVLGMQSSQDVFSNAVPVNPYEQYLNEEQNPYDMYLTEE